MSYLDIMLQIKTKISSVAISSKVKPYFDLTNAIVLLIGNIDSVINLFINVIKCKQGNKYIALMHFQS